MGNHVYSDDFGSITVSGHAVRVDLMVHSTTEPDPGAKPKLVVEHHLIMPLDGFLRNAARMNAVVLEFEKKGLITRTTKTSDKPTEEAK